MSGKFGKRVRAFRMQKQITLRQFCVAAKVDPSNWSKVERGLIPPPTHLTDVCIALEIAEGSDEWHELVNLAHLEKGIIPRHVMDNKEVMAALPVFFRTAQGDKPTREELEQILEAIRAS